LPRRLLLLILGFCVFLAPLAGAEMLRPAPEFVVKLTSGKQLLLSSFRGKVVALMFVSTDCPHCQDTTRFMESVQKQYGPKGFQTLAVAFNAMAVMLVQDFIKKTGATFPVGYEERDPVYSFLQRSVSLRTYVPIMVFIDRQGKIRGQYLGDDAFFEVSSLQMNIRTTVEKLLKEPPSAAPKSGPKK
jgi:thiol-disulfide isomerase/thioredoxin